MKKATFAVLLVFMALLIAVGTAAAMTSLYRASLKGDQEVPAVITNAVGHAEFKFNEIGTLMSYKITVQNITDVVAAHIHCAPAGVNGPVGVTLYSGAPAGQVNGLLVQAQITAPDAGNSCGWADLAAVMAAIESGDAYVNVHTSANPSGEIRGQIE